ncbi:MAG: hypothetical protein AMS27_03775 [Bacteroides sp. SM23_62_1]|nr:MAG: hypothetical protein AMS27_03775 [Bacteroides sp. SM23_62_1]
MAILFYVQDIEYKLSGKIELKDLIKKIINLHNKKTGEINIILTCDEKLLDLNKKYLNRDYYTDIITFDYSEKERISGDLYVSIERIKENAKEYKVNEEDELKRVIIHGILHLLGYKDEKEKDKYKMRKKENELLKKINKKEE